MTRMFPKVALAVTMALAAPAVLAEGHVTETGTQLTPTESPTPALSEGDIIIIGLLAALAAVASD